MTELVHGRVSLYLREQPSAAGPGLLLLHALGGSSGDWQEHASAWPGPAHALDFCGHGRSGRLTGGAYYSELLAADADAALAHLGAVHVAGSGIGAYVALLLAGARPEAVAGALLLPGAGLAGGGPEPAAGDGTGNPYTPASLPAPERGLLERPATDPRGVRLLEHELRPPDYARSFGEAARGLWLAEDGGARPPWWEALRPLPTARALRCDSTAAALSAFARESAAARP